MRAAAERGEALFGNIDTWVIWNLTGGVNGGAHVTDVTNASRTLLMNLHTLDWDDEILDILGIPRRMLPAIRPSSDPEIYGYALGKVPVCGDLGDQQAALVGQTCFGAGEAKNTYGTGCFMLLNTGPLAVPSKHGLLTTVAYKLGNAPAVYALEGSIAITGALVQWLRDNLGFFDFSQHVEDYARQVPDSGGIYFVPAFSGLFAPYWQADARGAIVGLTRFINKGHICRAALEATAYQTREVLDAMEQDSGVQLTALKVDGGMVHNDLLMQFQADILGVPVVRPVVAETTALGAAYAAGLAVGFWSNLDDLRRNWQVDRTWQPAMDERDAGGAVPRLEEGRGAGDALAGRMTNDELTNDQDAPSFVVRHSSVEAHMTQEFDALVIGGGATGGGTALDLALRGLRVALIERADLTDGTSGRYHGLLHSGGRYAVRDPESARECIEENRILRRIVPHAIEDTGGFFVTTPDDDPAYADTWLAACRACDIEAEEIPVAQMLKEEPALNPAHQPRFPRARRLVRLLRRADRARRGHPGPAAARC